MVIFVQVHQIQCTLEKSYGNEVTSIRSSLRLSLTNSPTDSNTAGTTITEGVYTCGSADGKR